MTEEVKDEDLKLTEQQDGSVVVGDAPVVEEQADESLKATDEEHGDEQEAAGESEEDAEARRERNRTRREEGKQRRKDYIDGLKRELAARDSIINDLSSRVAQVERRASGGEMAQLDAAEKEAALHYNHFREQNKLAIEQANGEAAIQAQERMFLARQRMEQLKGIKKSMLQQQNAPQPLDPRLVSQAQEWTSKHEWYDPSGKDDDSAMVLSIDSRMAAEGWNPTTPEYWDELSKRVEKYLPHRSKVGYNGQRNRGVVPVASSGRESSGGGASTSYKLSADRVKALKDAGMWDDPVQRAAAIKRFQAFDKENRA